MKLGSTGVSKISLLKDVDLTFLSDGKVLQYNDTTGKWEAVTIGGATGDVSILDDLTDVQVASAVSGQTLEYNGTYWVPVDGSSGGISEELEVIGFSINANNAITIGNKGYRRLPYNCEIQDWYIIANTDTANSVKINIQKTTDFNTYTDLISTELDKPYITNMKFNTDNTLSNWNISLTSDDIILYEIEEVTNILSLWFFMTIKRIVT